MRLTQTRIFPTSTAVIATADLEILRGETPPETIIGPEAIETRGQVGIETRVPVATGIDRAPSRPVATGMDRVIPIAPLTRIDRARPTGRAEAPTESVTRMFREIRVLGAAVPLAAAAGTTGPQPLQVTVEARPACPGVVAGDPEVADPEAAVDGGKNISRENL